MPNIIRIRKDIIDTRPIRVYQGAKSYRYRWKMMALLAVNNVGEFVLPFSRRLVHIDRRLWPRSQGKPPSSGFEECGCTGCENKSYEDHIFKDNEEDGMSESGNYHLEEVYVTSDDEEDDDDDQDNEQNKNSTESDNHDDKNEDSDSIISSSLSSSSHNSSLHDVDSSNNTSIDCDQFDESITISPFPCDPFESYDWEC